MIRSGHLFNYARDRIKKWRFAISTYCFLGISQFTAVFRFLITRNCKTDRASTSSPSLSLFLPVSLFTLTFSRNIVECAARREISRLPPPEPY